MIGTMVNALRVGLLPRWMGILGIFTGMLIFAPIGGAELEVVPAFWMVMMGILYVGKWPKEQPPAWAAGEARPWPSQAQMRAAKQAWRAGRAGHGRRGRGAASRPARPAPRASAGASGARDADANWLRAEMSDYSDD